MLKTHIKEELMQGQEDNSVYESMAHISTDLLMKCSLNPGCDEELYESMVGLVPSPTEDLCMYRVHPAVEFHISSTLKFTHVDNHLVKSLWGNLRGEDSLC